MSLVEEGDKLLSLELSVQRMKESLTTIENMITWIEEDDEKEEKKKKKLENSNKQKSK